VKVLYNTCFSVYARKIEMEKSISASEKSPIEILYMPNPAIEINEIANENMCSLISMHLLHSMQKLISPKVKFQ